MRRSVLWAALGERTVASSRIRAHELSDGLERRSWRSHVLVGSGARGRTALLGRVVRTRPEVVVLQKLLYGRVTLALLRRLAPVLVFECDDAVHLGYPGQSPRARARAARAVARIRRAVDVVTTTNARLAVDLAPRSGHTVIYAGPAPATNCSGTAPRDRVLVWIGSPSTSDNLRLAGDLPRRLRRQGWRTVAIGARPDAADAGWEVVDWSEAVAEQWLRRASVGLLPQVADAWSDRKAAYKALQYAAAGVVPVASDVEPAREILGASGSPEFLVADGGDWEAAVTTAFRRRSDHLATLERIVAEHSLAAALNVWENAMAQHTDATSRPKIAMVCSQAPPVYGGAGTQALALAQALAERGQRIDLFTQNQHLAPRRQEAAPHVTIWRAPGERIARRLPRRLAQMARTVAFLVWTFVRLSTARYDAIHLHGSYWFGVSASLAAALRRTPLLVKVTRLGEDDAETVRAKSLFGADIGWLYSMAFRRADVAVALSGEIAARHRRVFPEKRVIQLPNGVDVARFQRALQERQSQREHLGCDDGTFVVLFVGYLAPHKGVTALLDAWARFSAADDRPKRLVLVGPTGGFYRELESAVSDRAHADSAADTTITVMSHVAFPEMPAMYAAADCFVLPTQAEGMPNSLLEALAAGLPCISTNVPGVSEIAERAPKVATVDTATPEALAERLDEAARAWNPTDRAPGLPAEFSLGQVADTYVELYATLGCRR